MKNQNDLIVAGAILLVCIGVALVFMLEQRKPFKPAPPEQVVTTEAVPTGATVVYGNSLPGASPNAAAGVAGGSGQRRGSGPAVAGAGGG
ncbi:MAG TPA: hypothetical protein VNI20_03425 [Fimbriimonadaceae bacterium]|nr:hypothetical protein [Fimbriimonadaceae bacterium]